MVLFPCALLSRAHRGDRGGQNDPRILLGHIGGERRKTLVFAFRPADIQPIVPSISQAVVREPLFQSINEETVRLRRAAPK